jgi:hypothetical protein
VRTNRVDIRNRWKADACSSAVDEPSTGAPCIRFPSAVTLRAQAVESTRHLNRVFRQVSAACLDMRFTGPAPRVPQVIVVLSLVGHESVNFTAARCQDVFADKRGRLGSVFEALAGFTHASLLV